MSYSWNPKPHQISIVCPQCSREAIFEFAELVKIKHKDDISFFKANKLFDYRTLKNSSGQLGHFAIYYPGLYGQGTLPIKDLPEGYEAVMWDHHRYFFNNNGLDLGSIRCLSCHVRQKHQLSWPKEAYYQIDFRGLRLWAYHLESLIVLRDFIASDDRNSKKSPWYSFLLHVPTEFKKSKVRSMVVKKLNQLIK